jgi:RNase P subunit RPR2
MMCCEKCHKVLLTVQESSELHIRGEVTLVVLCQGCSNVNYIELYKYDKKRITRGDSK